MNPLILLAIISSAYAVENVKKVSELDDEVSKYETLELKLGVPIKKTETENEIGYNESSIAAAALRERFKLWLSECSIERMRRFADWGGDRREGMKRPGRVNSAWAIPLTKESVAALILHDDWVSYWRLNGLLFYDSGW